MQDTGGIQAGIDGTMASCAERAVRRRIVVVEDIDVQREFVVEYLTRSGFDVDQAADGSGLRRLCAQNRYDLAVVDLHLPDEDGLDLVRFLRSTQDAGIIVLTGNEDPTDRIVGLELGADDYLVKPHPPRELLARTKGLLRRIRPVERIVETTSTVKPVDAMDLGEWSIATGSRRLVAEGRETIELTAAEHSLLRILGSNQGTVLDRERLMRTVYDRAWEYEDRSMDVLVARLRQKIARTGIADRIRSVRGRGYVLDATT